MIPLATTTITVLATATANQYDEAYGGQTPAGRDVKAAGVRAVIDRPQGREQVAGSEQSIVDLWLVCDHTDLTHLDLVKDDRTGIVHRVEWVIDYGEHLEAGLNVVAGER